MVWIVCLVAVLIAVGRVVVVITRADTKSLAVECYKDVAHFYVGGLIGAWLVAGGYFGWVALVLTAVEIAAFVWTLFRR